ncbi:MAG: TlpA disulfide reductase family protein [Bryobacteraceae bacterium]
MRFLLTALVCLPLMAAGPLSNRRAPGFTLPDMNVNYHDLYDYRGKIVLLDILQTACPVCNSSQRIFETIRQKFPDKVVILSVVTQPDTQDTVKWFVTQNNVKTPVLFDCGQAIASYLKATPKNPQISLPHLFLIDAKGWIRNDWEYKSGNEKYFESLDPVLEEVTALVNEMGGGGAAKAPPAAPKAAPAKPAPKK